MKIKKILGITALCFSSLVMTSNSFAQTEINRDSWSVSSNRNAADSFSAIDGNANTRWSTRERQNDGQFFQVDFNETHVINQVVLDTSGSSNDYPRGYELQASTNGLNFTTIAAGEPSASGVTTINFTDRNVGILRIIQTGSDNRFWWSIHEINVFSDANNGSTDFSDTDEWSLSASENRDLRSAIDGNSNTRWATRETQRNGQFYQVNFNSDKSFDRILLDTTANEFDYPRNYTVRVSDNGNNFTTVATGTPSNSPQTLITFSPQTAQYIRIEQNGSDNRRWWSIHEMTISSGEINNNSNNNNSSNNNTNSNGLPEGVHPDIVRIADIAPEEILRTPPGDGTPWRDSYSVGDRCYCASTFDHDIGDILVDTPVGRITTREACDIVGPGPGVGNNPIYNDIQCGNGPDNNELDEMYCPGRVDLRREGCTHIGPVWNFN